MTFFFNVSNTQKYSFYKIGEQGAENKALYA